MKLSVKLKQPRDTDYKTFLGLSNVTIDVCKVFSGKAQSIFLEMILGDLKKSTNMMHPCPFKVSSTKLIRHSTFFLSFILGLHSNEGFGIR